MMSFTRALARTPVYHWHVAHGAHMVERNDWLIPASYSGVNREVALAHTGLGLVDLSACDKIALRGPGVAALAHALAGDSPASRPRGVAAFSAGSRVLACRLTEEHLLLLALSSNMPTLGDRLTTLSEDARLVQSNVSSAYAMFCLLGTAAEDVLNHLTALDVRSSAFPAGSCAEINLAGVHALLARPAVLVTVYIAVAWDVGEHVWESLLNASRGHEIRPVGLDAWHRLLSVDSSTSLG